jgi:penicillin-binding protein 1A
MASIRSLLGELKQRATRIAPGLSSRLAGTLDACRHPTRRGVIRALLAVPALLLLYVLILIPFTPSISNIRKASSEQPAQVVSADGRKLAEFKQSNRQWVALSEISPQVINALIATEDHRFYDHFGLDWRRTAAAALNTFRGDRQGGSTLTQQLARNLYPEAIGRDQTLTRKIKEAITALKIEAIHSKDEILETYLNTVPFLYNAYGIEMAARTYFDTSADQLDVLQSATLVGMLKGNSYYNPVLNPERSLQRRNTVLKQMVRREKLTQAQFDALSRKPLRIDFERQTEPPGPAPHFARYLRKWLIAWADRNGYSIYGDGLVVRTTIDSRLQAAANQAVTRQGNSLQNIANAAWGKRSAWSTDSSLVQAFIRESPEYAAAIAKGRTPEQTMQELSADKAFMRALQRQKTQIQIGFLAIDPRNGHVKAWVGSRDFEQDAFDHVRAGASPARLDLQALCLRRSVPPGRQPGRPIDRPGGGNPRRRRGGLAANGWHAAKRRGHAPERWARLFEEHHHRATHPASRPRQSGQTRSPHGRAPEQARSRAIARPGHQPRHPQGNGCRLRHDRQRRRLP